MSTPSPFMKHPWSFYSKKIASKIEHPQFMGFISDAEAQARYMTLVKGDYGSQGEGNWIRFYALVDPSDGVFADIKYQAYGPSALIAAAEGVCELAIRKNYDQISRFSADLLDAHLRDKKEKQAFPDEMGGFLNIVLFALEEATQQCLGMPLDENYVVSPVEIDASGVQEYPGWMELEEKKQILVLEEVIAKEIRPYIELDAGGVQVLKVKEGKEVIIAYQGSCTSCFSAVGATLNAIQQILRSKVHPELMVIPDASFLNLPQQ